MTPCNSYNNVNMAPLFWIVAIICFSSTTAECVSDCPHTKEKYQDGTLNIDAMQKTTCNCKKFQKDHITSGENKKHCIDFRFKIVWDNTPNVTDPNWEHCLPITEQLSPYDEELMDYDWVGLTANAYSNDLISPKGQLERAGPKEYILLVVLSVLLAIAVGAIFQQQKRKNMTIHDLESKNNELSHTIELYTRRYGRILNDG